MIKLFVIYEPTIKKNVDSWHRRERSFEPLKKSAIEYGSFSIPGIENVSLAGLTDHPDGGVSALIRMQKGSVIPHHEHKHFEETFLLKGSIDCGGTIIEARDYVRVDADKTHQIAAIKNSKFLVILHQGVILDGLEQ
tara:strand:+ start:200 stop:610 length:411 start_codon:yes stop_codon:yes gene_type:complete